MPKLAQNPITPRTPEYIEGIKEEQALDLGDVFIAVVEGSRRRYSVGFIHHVRGGVLLDESFASKADAVSFARKQRALSPYTADLYDFTRLYGKRL